MVLIISVVLSWLMTSKFPSISNAFAVWPKYLRGGRGEINFSFNYKHFLWLNWGVSWSRDVPEIWDL